MAECQQTLDVDMVDGVLEEEDEEKKESQVWGRLFPLSKSFAVQGECARWQCLSSMACGIALNLCRPRGGGVLVWSQRCV